jgi:hypothetical protein
VEALDEFVTHAGHEALDLAEDAPKQLKPGEQDWTIWVIERCLAGVLSA